MANIGMYIIGNEKITEVGKDERVITIRATKGSGEKTRYVKVQTHSNNWFSLLSQDVIRELVEKAEDTYLIGLVKKYGFLNSHYQTREAFELWFNETQVSSRLSKESITSWFQEDMSGILVETLERKGLSTEKAEMIAAEYLKQFQSLAGKNVSMNQNVKGQLEKCLALLPADYESVIAEKIAEKLSSIGEDTDILNAL